MLTVKPQGKLFYKPPGGSMVFTCDMRRDATDTDYIDDEVNKSETTSTASQLQWLDGRGQPITDRTGRSASASCPS